MLAFTMTLSREIAPSLAARSLEFEPGDIAACVTAWRSTAGREPARVMHVENGAGIVAMFAPIGCWDELGTARDFDLVYPARTSMLSAVRLSEPWHALPISDFLVHIYDASRSAPPEEVIRVMVGCIEALAGGLPERLIATSLVPRDPRA
jgi:hypothetical protein